jgi:type II secretory ATPase GspE/PulE/Tfp pilus assembly ATPase PilB-like protein
VPLFQLIEFDGSDFSQSIFNRLEAGASADEIDQMVFERSGSSLRGEANKLIELGITDANEVFRVLGRHA